MKVCQGNDVLISMYLDGELEGEERDRLVRHMESCEACREYYRQMCMVQRSIGIVDIPPGLHENIMKSVEKERLKGLGRRRRKFFAAAVAAAAGLFLCFSVFTGSLPFMKQTSLGTEQEGAEMAELKLSDSGEGVSVSTYDANSSERSVGASSDQTAMTIESQMAWFSENEGDMAVVENYAEDSAGQMENLAEYISDSLNGSVDGFGYYLITEGKTENVPESVASNLTDIKAGSLIFIKTTNSLQAKQDIYCSMSENGFEIYEDSEGEYFAIDETAENGLLIIELE